MAETTRQSQVNHRNEKEFYPRFLYYFHIRTGTIVIGLWHMIGNLFLLSNLGVKKNNRNEFLQNLISLSIGNLLYIDPDIEKKIFIIKM